VAVAVPCRYIHSPVSLLDLSDFQNTVKLMKGALDRLCRKMALRRGSAPLGGSGIPNLFGRLPLGSQQAPQQVEDSPLLGIFRQSLDKVPGWNAV
jgi:hypothetical protein